MVIVGFTLANLSFFFVLPLSVTSTSLAIAVAFGAQVLGPVGSLLLALTVSGSGFGSLNASVFTSSRLFYAAGREGYLPKIVGTLGIGNTHGMRIRNQPGSTRKAGLFKRTLSTLCADDTTHALFHTPIWSLVLNFIITVIYIILGSFEALITFYGLAAYLFYFLTVLGLLILRVNEPHLERPYRCWITTPVVFCCVSLFLLSRSIVAQPWTSGAVVVFVAIGLLIYFVKARRNPKPGTREGFRRTSSGWQFWKRWGRT